MAHDFLVIMSRDSHYWLLLGRLAFHSQLRLTRPNWVGRCSASGMWLWRQSLETGTTGAKWCQGIRHYLFLRSWYGWNLNKWTMDRKFMKAASGPRQTWGCILKGILHPIKFRLHQSFLDWSIWFKLVPWKGVAGSHQISRLAPTPRN